MYTNYGKACRSARKPTQDAAKDSEEVEDTSVEEALGSDDDSGEEEGGELSRETTYLEGNIDGNEGVGGEYNVNEDEGTGEYENMDGEGGVDGDETLEGEGKTDGDENEYVPEEEEVKQSKIINKVMEYDIKEMYPEMNILVQKKKREWDYQDPDIIRALWLESKTNVLAEWKIRNAKVKTGKPSIEVRDTVTVTLRQEHMKNKEELKKALEEREFAMTEISEVPHFDSIQLATNLTTEMRYKYNRNNPPVPSHYVEHFEKFRKPPFKNNTNTLSWKSWIQ